ncbi:MAG: hypothetical protein QY326_04125 [Bdellovibrionota bacterium]|nr:MAG: hypothetical protein QY326_04125 [Bdellovibrionota bacterium]
MINRYPVSAAIALAIALMLMLSSGLSAQPGCYNLQRINGSDRYGFSINNSGIVVGTENHFINSFSRQSLMWVQGVEIPIGGAFGGLNNSAVSVNDVGDVVGNLEIDPYRQAYTTYVYRHGEVSIIELPPSMLSIFPAAVRGDGIVLATVINSAGKYLPVMVKQVGSSQFSFHVINPATSASTENPDLGYLAADFNARLITLTEFSLEGAHLTAFRAAITKIEDKAHTIFRLPLADGYTASVAWAIDSKNSVVGEVFPDWYSYYRPALWKDNRLIDLAQGNSDWMGSATDINDHEQVVGKLWNRFNSEDSSWAFIYEGGELRNLNELLCHPLPAWDSLASARAINDRGQIVVAIRTNYGEGDSTYSVGVLTPRA